MCYNLEEISSVLSVLDKYEIPNKKLYVDAANMLLKSGDLKTPQNKRIIDRKLDDSIFSFKGDRNIQNLTASDVLDLRALFQKNINGLKTG